MTLQGCFYARNEKWVPLWNALIVKPKSMAMLASILLLSDEFHWTNTITELKYFILLGAIANQVRKTTGKIVWMA